MGETAACTAESTSEVLRKTRLLSGDAFTILPSVKLLYPLAAILRECKFSEWAPDAETRLRDPLAEMLNALDGILNDPPEDAGRTLRRVLQAYLELVEALRVLGALRQAERAGVLEALRTMGQRVLAAKGADGKWTMLGGRLASIER
jgi:hypothetical protein